MNAPAVRRAGESSRLVTPYARLSARDVMEDTPDETQRDIYTKSDGAAFAVLSLFVICRIETSCMEKSGAALCHGGAFWGGVSLYLYGVKQSACAPAGSPQKNPGPVLDRTGAVSGQPPQVSYPMGDDRNLPDAGQGSPKGVLIPSGRFPAVPCSPRRRRRSHPATLHRRERPTVRWCENES